jgi:hypothetical protein
MRVGSKSLARSNRVVINNPERTEATVVRVIVSSKGKGVEGIKPSVIRVESISRAADLQFDWVRCHGNTLPKSFHAG